MKENQFIKFLVLVFIMNVSNMGLAQKSEVEIRTSAICEMCKNTIEYDLTFTKGIKFVELDTATKIVKVAFSESKITPEAIRRRIAALGYHADEIRRDSLAYIQLPPCCKDGAHGSLIEEY